MEQAFAVEGRTDPIRRSPRRRHRRGNPGRSNAQRGNSDGNATPACLNQRQACRTSLKRHPLLGHALMVAHRYGRDSAVSRDVGRRSADYRDWRCLQWPRAIAQCWLMGFDVGRESLQVRSSIGYVPQAISVDGALTARENLDFYASVTGVSGVANGVGGLRK